MSAKNRRFSYVLALLAFCLVTLLWGNATGSRAEAFSESVVQPATATWTPLVSATPVAYSTPLPSAVRTPLDGTYAKFVESPPQWWLCRRCADYRPIGGTWTLQFDRGVLHIYYDVTGWRSLASYTIEGDQLSLFNDPYCKEAVGQYTWRVEEGVLLLESVEDGCSFGLRARNLSEQPWPICPAVSEATGEAEPLPRGCEATPLPTSLVLDEEPLTVNVYGSDARFFETPPDLIIHANQQNQPQSAPIEITASERSLPFGLNRVLWADGDWIEAAIDEMAAAVGVQFRGPPFNGWASVYFDDQEVWRGDTSTLWNAQGIHAGYVEVVGFEPGNHTLRVERLSTLSRPVVVGFFGLNQESGVVSTAAADAFPKP